MSDTQEITKLEQAFHELEKIKQQVILLSDFLLSQIKAEKKSEQKNRGMIDPRTGRPFRQKRR